MTETLHWYAETTGGVRQGDAPVHPGCGALHLSTDLPAGTLKAVRAELPWKMEADERLFMNGYQTWTYSPELNRNGKLRGTDHIPGFLRKKYAFDRYGDYHFVPYGHHNGQSHGFSYCYFRKGGQFQLVASLDETPGYIILRYDSGIPAAALLCSTCFLPRAARPKCLTVGFGLWASVLELKRSWLAIPAGTTAIRTSPRTPSGRT